MQEPLGNIVRNHFEWKVSQDRHNLAFFICMFSKCHWCKKGFCLSFQRPPASVFVFAACEKAMRQRVQLIELNDCVFVCEFNESCSLDKSINQIKFKDFAVIFICKKSYPWAKVKNIKYSQLLHIVKNSPRKGIFISLIILQFPFFIKAWEMAKIKQKRAHISFEKFNAKLWNMNITDEKTKTKWKFLYRN